MERFITLTGVAAPLPMDHVDTDKIIPARFLKTIKRTGLAKGLFHDLRHHEDGQPRADFVLHQPKHRDAKILITGENFGCGSSREHAPWALLDHGIRCVIAHSFADIFFNNCFKNGLLPIALPDREQVSVLMDYCERDAEAVLTVDLHGQKISAAEGILISFEVDPFCKHCLINGLDDIGLTLERADRIEAFEHRHRQAQPWHHS